MALLRSNSFIDDIITCLKNLDEALSRSLVGPPVIRNLLFTIEYTMNGYTWAIGSPLALIVSVKRRSKLETQHKLVLLNIGVFLDIIISSILKVIIRRPRPSYNLNDQAFEGPADVFSFPSGHCARAAMLTALCIGFYPKCRNAAMLMTLVIALSRVTMGRHYVSDALGGLLTGWLEGKAVLALSREFSKWLGGVFP